LNNSCLVVYSERTSTLLGYDFDVFEPPSPCTNADRSQQNVFVSSGLYLVFHSSDKSTKSVELADFLLYSSTKWQLLYR